MILRINEDLEIDVLLDSSTEEAKTLMHKGSIAYSKLDASPRNIMNLDKIAVAKEINIEGYHILEYENSSIKIDKDGEPISPVKPVLRTLAKKLNVSILNGNGNKRTTRQLGSLIIKTVSATD